VDRKNEEKDQATRARKEGESVGGKHRKRKTRNKN
jgi:hypothetical protein